uniref:Thioredoxin domain-containing protein n=1 Tax=Aplanochytrium stocchinoi TaxID=215587 RepID=A0A7S3PNS4_9STRA|mmetsp:Transcript_27747/g.33925  ORF Transcript_27747/g.33925 Transcript_27747/m.33925 type:complete len:181 (+) Transcript_27747:183-725(+)
MTSRYHSCLGFMVFWFCSLQDSKSESETSLNIFHTRNIVEKKDYFLFGVCPLEIEPTSCTALGLNPQNPRGVNLCQRKEWELNSTSSLLIEITTLEDAKIFEESFVFVYMNGCPYSAEFSRLVYAAAQAYPNAIFHALESFPISNPLGSLNDVNIRTSPTFLYIGRVSKEYMSFVFESQC